MLLRLDFKFNRRPCKFVVSSYKILFRLNYNVRYTGETFVIECSMNAKN